MIFRNLDADHDWTFGQGKANYISDDAAIGLNIETRILSWLNDCFFDMAAGVDWLNRLGSKNQRTMLENDLKRIILQSFGVTAINSFSTSVTGRDFRAEYDIQTIFSASYQRALTQDIQNAG